LYNASTSVECSFKANVWSCETIEATIKDIVDDKIKTHADAHVNPLIETVNKQQKTITEQAQTLSKQAAIIITRSEGWYALSIVPDLLSWIQAL
jgi:hypothetical protein